MAEYSKEYCELMGEDSPGDFSYRKEFSKLKEGESFYEICEGFGIFGITKICANIYAIVENEKLIEFDVLLKDKRLI